MKKAKIEMETLGKLLLLTAFLIIFLLMFKGCKDQMDNVGTVGTNEYVCWFSHALKAKISFLFPSACYPIDVGKDQDKNGISILMRKCWWMHGQGEEDIATSETNIGVLGKTYVSWWYDVARTCYIFTPKEDMPIQDFITYLRKYDKSGKEVKEDSKQTTWGYIQNVVSAGTAAGAETGICFDKEIGDYMSKGKMYYIIFYDDRGPISKGPRDRIMISRDPEFGDSQTGLLASIKERFTDLGCSKNWGKEAQKIVEEAKKESVATTFFDNLVKYLKECSTVKSDDRCVCGSLLEEIPFGYAIKIEPQSEKKYVVSLLKDNKPYKQNETNFVEEIEGARIGYWTGSVASSNECASEVIKSTKNINTVERVVMFDPNNQKVGCSGKDNYAVYIIPQSQAALLTAKKCR